MQQFIAPNVLTVNGKPSSCECTDKVVCAYCVQANLILWERAERQTQDIEDQRKDVALNMLRKLPQKRSSEILGVGVATLHRRLKSKRIPEPWVEKILKVAV